MKDREHNDSMSLGAEKHRVREATRCHTADFVVLEGETFRLCCRKLNGVIDLRHELGSKTGSPRLIPQRCGIKLGPCSAPEDDL
jgi:hypothetical protein